MATVEPSSLVKINARWVMVSWVCVTDVESEGEELDTVRLDVYVCEVEPIAMTFSRDRVKVSVSPAIRFKTSARMMNLCGVVVAVVVAEKEMVEASTVPFPKSWGSGLSVSTTPFWFRSQYSFGFAMSPCTTPDPAQFTTSVVEAFSPCGTITKAYKSFWVWEGAVLNWSMPTVSGLDVP